MWNCSLLNIIFIKLRKDFMTYFSKKTSNIIVAFSILFLIISTVLVLFSNQLVDVIYQILSQKVFHRDFSIEKWLSSILSFTLIPMFGIVAIDVFLFVKLPDKQKIILISSLLAIFTVAILYTVQVSIIKHVDSDLASELLLGKECLLEKSFWPRGWYYSTEIRLINTQFFSTLGWFFTDNMSTVKTIQSFFTCLCLFWAEWYLLTQLEIKTLWLKLLTTTLSFLPFSWLAYYVGCGHNYYIPHAIFALIYTGTFIKVFLRTQTIKTGQSQKLWLVFFYLLAFISGLTSIRYIMNFVFPLFLATIIVEAKSKEENTAKITDFKGFWIKNKLVFASTLGLLISVFGYVCNNILLKHFFSFSEWNSMNFNHFGDTTIRDILSGIVEIFGYNEGIAALTPGGAINILVYAALLIFVVYLIISLKTKLDKASRTILSFFISSILFNIYLYIHIDYITRYFYPLMLIIFPCLAILIEKSELSDIRKWALGTLWAGVIITSSYASLSRELNTDVNTDKYAVANYLKNSDYNFGFASFWNSSVFTYLTNGKVEVGNLYRTKENGNEIFTEDFKYDKWLTPARYYTENKDGNIFLLITQEQYKINSENSAIKKGKEVYSDDYFKVLDYESYDAFVKSFE